MAKKIVLSRKGFDSGTGGKPSPIIGEQLISLPIPQAGSGVFYQDLRWQKGKSYLDLMRQLGITFYSEAHLDPDLSAEWRRSRPRNWKPAFGQTGAAASHLLDQGVGVGDLFLFFGWFRATEQQKDGRRRFAKQAPDLHVLYGYLEVEQVIDLNQELAPDWAREHPHWVFRALYAQQRNCLFIAREQSSIWPGKSGAGLFPFARQRMLSTGEGNRSEWKLPAGFFQKTTCRLSYHEKRASKAVPGTKGAWRTLQSVARGQEFVCSRNPKIDQWLKEIGP